MEKKENPCRDLVFSRSPSRSCRTKVKDFWIFLDSQDNIKPYLPPKGAMNFKLQPSLLAVEVKQKREMAARENIPHSATATKVGTWYDKLKTFHRLGLVETALAANKKCKTCRAIDSVRNAEFADTVVQSYEKLNVEIEAFDKREKCRKDEDSLRDLKKIPKPLTKSYQE